MESKLAEAIPFAWVMQDKGGGDYWMESFCIGPEPGEDETDDAEWVPMFLHPAPARNAR